MTDKQYLEAITQLLEDFEPYMTKQTQENTIAVIDGTIYRLEVLKAQEDNVKSEMWEE